MLMPPSGIGPAGRTGPSGRTGASGRRTSKAPIIAAIVAGVLLIIGIRYFTTRDDDPSPGMNPLPVARSRQQPPRDGCTTVTIAASSEKAALLGEIANTYRDSGRTVDGRCFDIMVSPAASGTAETDLATGWDDTWTDRRQMSGRPPPRPGSGCCRATLTARDRPNIGPGNVGIGHLHAAGAGHARADGEGARVADRADRLGGSVGPGHRPAGWAANGTPGVGQVPLGKTNPNISTSGLAATIGTSGGGDRNVLRPHRPRPGSDPEVRRTSQEVERPSSTTATRR